MRPYLLHIPEKISLPIVLSLPHIGTEFPESIAAQIKTAMLPPDDTDWHLDKLYSFTSKLGIPVIQSVYSRWVIDLNRNPDNLPLYHDGRIITNNCTTTNFAGEAIYADDRTELDSHDIAQRKRVYFDPYHEALQGLLDKVHSQFGVVLLWDGHSIRRSVPTIALDPFPDFILGNNDGITLPIDWVNIVANGLENAGYSVALNAPFKGGYITRHYGLPDKHQFALQLEMSKDLYMSHNETRYAPEKTNGIQHCLSEIFIMLGKELLKTS